MQLFLGLLVQEEVFLLDLLQQYDLGLQIEDEVLFGEDLLVGLLVDASELLIFLL